ncbi:MAG TPA: hypothetical protein VKU02_03755 [Gemmataceae bacterium]|nr:hypothetical protein [Gemmataceae bacterium]
MGQQEQSPFDSEAAGSAEAHSASLPATEHATENRPTGNWEGYSLEILSVWFDP